MYISVYLVLLCDFTRKLQSKNIQLNKHVTCCKLIKTCTRDHQAQWVFRYTGIFIVIFDSPENTKKVLICILSLFFSRVKATAPNRLNVYIEVFSKLSG